MRLQGRGPPLAGERKLGPRETGQRARLKLKGAHCPPAGPRLGRTNRSRNVRSAKDGSTQSIHASSTHRSPEFETTHRAIS